MKKASTLLLYFAISICSLFSQQLAWLKLPDFPGGERYQPSSFAINGKGYVGMGIDSSHQYHKDWYEYDPIGNTWTEKTLFPSTARDHCSGFVVDTLGYLIGGEISSGAINEIWQYNPLTDSWAQKTNLTGAARESGAGFVLNKKIYYGTGYVGGSTRVDLFEYNPATDSWSQKADLPGGIRNAAVGFSVNGKGYLGLGAHGNNGVFYNDLYEYDSGNDSWSPKANYPMGNAGASAYQSANAGYVLCGSYEQYNGGITVNPLNLLYKYTSSDDSWNLEGSFPGLPRCYAAEFSIGKDIYFGMGSQTLGATSIVNGHTPMLSDFWKLAQIIDSVALSIHDNNGGERRENMVKIFPNPSHEYLNISTEVLPTISHIRIYDAEGNLVDDLSVSGNIEQLNISKLAAGTYFVELVTNKKEVITSRFNKQ